MGRDEPRNRETYYPYARVAAVSVHQLRQGGQHKMQAADADEAAFDGAKSRFFEQRHDLSWVHVAMPVKVREEPGFTLRDPKIDDKHAPSRLEHATNLACTLLT